MMGNDDGAPGLTPAIEVSHLTKDFGGLGWRIVSPMFDRERLIAGIR